VATRSVHLAGPGWSGPAKAAVVLAVLGVVGFDGVSLLLTHLSTSDSASSGATAAATVIHDHGSLAAAEAAAASAAGAGERVTGMTVDPDGTVHLSVRSSATSLVLRHVHDSWTTVRADASAAWTP